MDERSLGSESQDLSHVLTLSLAVCVTLEHGSKLHFAGKELRLRGDQGLGRSCRQTISETGLLVLALPLTGARVNLSGIIIYKNVNCYSRTMPSMSWDSLFRFMVMMTSLISILSVVQLLVYVYPRKWWRQASFRVLQGSLCRACLEHCVGRILVPILSSSYHYWLLVQNSVAIPETEGGGELLLP